MENDRPVSAREDASEDLPLMHSAVRERFLAVAGDCPAALRGLRYRLFDEDEPKSPVLEGMADLRDAAEAWRGGQRPTGEPARVTGQTVCHAKRRSDEVTAGRQERAVYKKDWRSWRRPIWLILSWRVRRSVDSVTVVNPECSKRFRTRRIAWL